MSFDTYDGARIGMIDDYVITESNIRPRGFRFEASREDGEPSLFGDTLEDLRAEIDNRNTEQADIHTLAVLVEEENFEEAERLLNRLKSTYGDEHPDLIRCEKLMKFLKGEPL